MDSDHLTVTIDKKNVCLNPIAKIGDVEYDSVQKAVDSAKSGDTVKLLKDTSTASCIKTTTDITLDLNGKALTGTTSGATATLSAEGSTLTIQDSSIDKNGKIIASEYGIAAFNGAKIIVQNGTVEANYAALSGNNTLGDMNFEINGGTLTSKLSEAIYMPGQVSLVVNDGTINGGISTRMGQVTINGGIINGMTGSTDNIEEYYNTGSSIWIGDAIYVLAGTYTSENTEYGNNSNIIINGGEIHGKNQYAVAIYRIGTQQKQEVNVNINGGSFDGQKGTVKVVSDKYTGKGVSSNPDNVTANVCVSGGIFNTKFDNSYCATGLTIIDNTDTDTKGNYPYTIDMLQANTENNINAAMDSGDNVVNVELPNVNEKTKEDAKTAAGTVELANALTDKSEITDTDKQKGVTELKKAGLVNVDENGKITDNKTVTIVKETYLDVNVTKFDVSGENPAVTMDITPKYNLIATVAGKDSRNDSNSVTIAAAQPMEITTATQVSVTIPEFANKKVYIDHNNGKNIYVATANADGKIEFTTNGFSPFTFTLTNQDVVAEVNGNAYKTLQEAANAAKDGDEITVIQNKKLTLNFNATKSVKVINKTTDNITVKFNGVDKEVAKNATETFSYTKSSSSGKTTYKVTTSAANNGGVNVSPSSAVNGATITITLSPDKGYKLEKLTVTDNSGKSISTTKKSDTVYTFVMPASQVKVSASYVKDDAAVVKPAAGFNDVAAAAWYANAVKYAVDKGMMNGVGNNKFAPDGVTDRGMIVTVLYRLENEPTASAASFTDVASGAYYANAVAWASANGIVTGYGNGKFGPNDPITREQFASILYRYAQYKKYDVSVGEDTNILSYTDAQSISSYAVPAIQWACGAGVMNGSNGRLSPKSGATRAQAAQLLMNFCENAAK